MAFSKARRLSDFIAADGTIPTAKFASSTITSAHLVDGTIAHADLHTDMDLTGKTVLVANASTGDSDTTAANTAFVQQEIAALVDSSPGTLNTLNELAAALGDDANFSTTITNSIATKLPLAGGTMTGLLTAGAKLKITDLGNATVAALQLGNSGLGISSPSTDQMNFITADTTRMVIDSSGNVGIGTSSFNATYDPRLQVTSAANDGTGGILIQNYLPTLTLEDISGGAAVSQIQQDQTNMLFKNNGAERMRIASDGAVTLKPDGITTGLRLQGRSSDNNFFIQWNSNNGSTNYGSIGTNTGQSAGYYSFDNHIFTNTLSNTTYMTIDSNGQVMIGHTSSFAHADADNLAIGNGTSNSGLTIYTGGDKESSIIFGNTGTNGNIEAGIKYYHESHGTVANRRAMTFATGGSMQERMRIDSAGRVGIGVSSSLGNLLTIAHTSHGIGFDYVGSTLPSIAGLFTSSIGMTETAYGDLNIKARTDYGGYYGIGFFTSVTNSTPRKAMAITSSAEIEHHPSTGSGLHVEKVLPRVTPNYPGSGQMGTAENWYQPPRGESGIIHYGNTNNSGGEYRCAGFIVYSAAEANNTPPAITISVTESVGGNMVAFDVSGGYIRVQNTYGYGIELMGYVQAFRRG